MAWQLACSKRGGSLTQIGLCLLSLTLSTQHSGVEVSGVFDVFFRVGVFSPGSVAVHVHDAIFVGALKNSLPTQVAVVGVALRAGL